MYARGSPLKNKRQKTIPKENITVQVPNNVHAVAGPSGVPSVNEQLAHFNPSKELLSYYHQKIGKYQEEWDEIVKKLDHYSKLYNDEYRLEKELQSKNDEVILLQKMLSDMQLSLFQEREHVLRLYKENDRLKLCEIEDRKQIQHLLALSGQVQADSKTYYYEEPLIYNRNRRMDVRKRKENDQEGKEPDHQKTIKDDKMKSFNDQIENMKFEIESLYVQLQERETLFHEEVAALTSDLNITRQEAEIQRSKDAEKIKHLTEKLKQTTDILQQITKDYVSFRKTVWNTETNWAIEKTKLLEEIDNVKIAIERYKEKTTLTEELSTMKQELVDYVQQSSIINEINILKNTFTDFTIPLIEELKILREQLLQCLEQADLQRQLSTESKHWTNKKLSPLKKQLLQKNSQQLKDNIHSVLEHVSKLADRTKDIHTTSVKTVQQKFPEQEKLDSIKKYLNRVSDTVTSLEKSEERTTRIRPMKVQTSGNDSDKVLVKEINELVKETETYRLQCVSLEEELNRFKEMHTESINYYKEKCKKLEGQLESNKEHYQQLVRNHKTEIEGLKTDIRNLKTKLINIEKELLKATLQLESNYSDVSFLKAVHSTTVRSKQIADEIKGLKYKLYELENNLKKI